MTREQILKMPAGRELDALIAEKLFGFRWWRSSNTGRRCLYPPGENPEWMQTPADGMELLVHDYEDCIRRWVPFYSTSISAAWEVSKEWQSRGYHYAVEYVGDGFEVSVWAPNFEASAMDVPAETVELGICRAALCLRMRQASRRRARG